jgi:membrane protease subunit HflC
MMREARDLIRSGMEELGITVVDVRILRTDLTTDVSKQTFERMSAERLAEAAAIRAGGQQAAQSLKAIADRQAVEIVAAANRDSEVLRGEGDAQRTNIYAQAYGADPEFYQFYRSLQSYRTALGTSGTSLVLSPDSEFFRYFGADTLDGAPPRPAAPGGIAPLPASDLTPAPIEVPPADEPVVTLDQATPPITAEPPTPDELAQDGAVPAEEPAAAQ